MSIAELPHENSSKIPEALQRFHEYGVIMPYSSNIRELGPNRGDVRLSFYSNAVLNAALKAYLEGKFGSFILFSDATFADQADSTGQLMEEGIRNYLKNLKERGLLPSDVKASPDIILFDDLNLNNTPLQIKTLAHWQRKQHVSGDDMIFFDHAFHDERVRNHLKGYEINADVITAADVQSHYHPKFNRDAFKTFFEEIEMRENAWKLGRRRQISRYDKKGRIPMFAKKWSGPVTTDWITNHRKTKGEKVEGYLESVGGPEKLAQVKNIASES